MTSPSPVTAMIPAHRRLAQTVDTIRRLQACDPPPGEILVHVSSAEQPMRETLARECPTVRVLLSEDNLGPGGGRNKMLEAARNELVASFDDDSYPLESDFFARLVDWFERVPEASIIAMNIFEPADPRGELVREARWVADFVGCGCAYRRSHFLEAPGYVPIPIAYSMEEADLALRYGVRGRRILYVTDLRIYHDTQLQHHASAEVAGMQVANTALFAFLRYPMGRWPFALVQFGHKWVDTVRRGRFKGALLAFPYTVRQVFRYRRYRATVPAREFDRQRQLRQRGGISYDP